MHFMLCLLSMCQPSVILNCRFHSVHLLLNMSDIYYIVKQAYLDSCQLDLFRMRKISKAEEISLFCSFSPDVVVLVEMMHHSSGCNVCNWWHVEWVRNGDLKNVPPSGACLMGTWAAWSSNSHSSFSLWSLEEFLKYISVSEVISASPFAASSRIWIQSWRGPWFEAVPVLQTLVQPAVGNLH